jgi:hypothetical protein
MRAVHVVGGGTAGGQDGQFASLVPGRFLFHATQSSGLKIGA